MKLLVLSLISLRLLFAGDCLASESVGQNSINPRNVWYRDLGASTISRGEVNLKSSSVGPQVNRSSETVGDNSTKPSVRKTVRSEEVATFAPAVCDFGGRKMRIAASPQPPLVNCFQDFYGEWLCNGSNVEVIKLLGKRLNFKTDWVVLANNLNSPIVESDRVSSNKSVARNFTGVIGLVGSGRAFMGANGIMSTVDRMQQKLLLSEPFDSFKLHFLLSKSVRDHDHIFIKPFSSSAWAAIILSGLFMTGVFYVINSTSSHYLLKDDKFLAKHVPLFKSLHYYLVKMVFERRRRFSVGGKRSTLLGVEIFRNFGWLTSRRRTSSEYSSNSSRNFKQEVDRMVASQGVLPFETQFVSLKIEQRRRFRSVCKRWAWERKRARRASKSRHQAGFFRLPYLLWYVVGSLANQGGETEDLPQASSTRILVAFWWLYLIVICSIHSGILTAILTFPKQLDFIQTLEDYLKLDESERMEMRLTVDRGSETGNLLANPDNLHKSPLQQLLRRHSNGASMEQKNETVNLGSVGEYQFKHPIQQVDFQRHRQRVLDEVRRGQAAYLEERAAINLIITQEFFDQKPPKCELKTSRFPVDIVPMSLIINKELSLLGGDNCLEEINKLLGRILRTGLAQKWRRKYEPQGNDCLNTVVINAGDVQKIQLRHVILAFWLLAGGLLLGAKSLLLEVFWLFAIETDEEDEDETGSSLRGEKRRRRRRASSSSSSSSSTSSDTSGICSSSTSCGSQPGNSPGSDQLRLGHRVVLLSSRPIKSLKDGGKDLSLKRMLKRTKKRSGNLLARKVAALPPSSTSLSLVEQQQVSLSELDNQETEDAVSFQQESTALGSHVDIRELSEALKAERRSKRAARAARKRARRMKRTMELVKKIHEGKIYSKPAGKLSGGMQSRKRAAAGKPR